MRFHEISDNEWKEMNEEERITVLLTYGLDRKEAWELRDTEHVSNLPRELAPSRSRKAHTPLYPVRY
jgi:hypothetical protein